MVPSAMKLNQNPVSLRTSEKINLLNVENELVQISLHDYEKVIGKD